MTKSRKSDTTKAMYQTKLKQPALAPKRPTILITGAFSGLGRAFFESFAEDAVDDASSENSADYQVIGIDKQPWPDQHGNPKPSHAHGPRSLYVQADVTSPRHELEALIHRWVGAETPIQLVVHCAGVRGLVPGVQVRGSDDVARAEAWGVMDAETMMRTFEVNTVGTFNLLTAVVPNLRIAAAEWRFPRVAVMSSRIGSMAANARGGAYAYRASKAALNAVVRSLSVDVPEVYFGIIHPGRVETGLVSVKEDGAISCKEALEDLVPLLSRLGEDNLKSGCFVDRFGHDIPW